MLAGKKLYLQPTKTQAAKMFECANVARFAYNFSLGLREKAYADMIDAPQLQDLIVVLQEFKRLPEHEWVTHAPVCVTDHAIKDMLVAYKNFFQRGNKGFPKFKRKGHCKISYYQRADRLHVSKDGKGICLTNIGAVRCKAAIDLPQHCLNPRVCFDGKHWYIAMTYEVGTDVVKTTDVSLGIDLGLKNLVTCSNGIVYPNINKTRRVVKLEKRLKRLQRQVSRKYERNRDGAKYIRTQNIIDLQRQI